MLASHVATLTALVVVLSSCTASIDGAGPSVQKGDLPGPGAGPDAGPGDLGPAPDDPPGDAIDFLSPANDSSHLRDDLDAHGDRVAAADVELALRSDVVRVELTVGGQPSATLGSGVKSYRIEIPTDATVDVIARAYGASGVELGIAGVRLYVSSPQLSCHEWLDVYQLDFESGPSLQGVANPVTVQTPINGLEYQYYDQTAPRTSMVMDCSTALSLARMAPILRKRDIATVIDLGLYNYRCIGSTGTPPNCPNGMSQHSFGTAIDIYELRASSGATYSIERDWIIDGASTPTCSAVLPAGKNALLHDVVCEMFADGLWTTALTPNYNADHRNHFHLDLDPDGTFLRSWTEVDEASEHRH